MTDNLATGFLSNNVLLHCSFNSCLEETKRVKNKKKHFFQAPYLIIHVEQRLDRPGVKQFQLLSYTRNFALVQLSN